MDDEQPTTAGRRRGKGAEATARAGALERLKALRCGGRRSENGGARYSIKMENPIYDTVPEEEYDKLVARRREEAHGFIVDDGDGGDLGYGDEGQEEDWSLAGLPPSSGEDSDGELNIRKRRRAEKKEKETAPVKKVNAALTAAAAMMGKQSISKMFTSTVLKNKDSAKVKSVDCESIVDEVIAEFAPDENDRERRRKAQLGSKPLFVPMKSENHAVSHINLLENATNGGNNEADRDYEDAQEENGNLLSEMKEEAEIAGTGDDPMAEDAAVEVKVGPSVEVKKEKGGEKGRVLNAKIGVVEREGLVSARSVWEEMRSVGDGGLKEEGKSEGNPEFEISEDGSTQFYIIDAYEEVVGLTIPKLYLFGKVKAGNAYHSCCVIVKNMQRCVFAIPNSSIFCTDEIIRLEKDAEESRISPTEFRKKLQDVSYELKNEIATQLVNQNVSSFSMAPVKRKYAFERSDIPIGENYVLKINYPFEKAPLPSDLKGKTFCALLGTHSSALELFLVKRRIKGPSWLSISRFSTCPPSRRTSWCKFEITVDSPKDISVSSSKKTTEIPPVIVSAISLKTAVNEKQNVEIVSASVICCHKAKVDTPMLASEWKKPGMLSHFSVIRQFGREIYPMGFLTEATDINTKAGSNVLCVIKHRDCNERALLIRLMTELHKLDSDVLVGHNISGFDLDVLLRRAKACGVPGNMWSKIGRLNRDVMPNLTKRNSIFGSGASPGMMSCIAGRLLCDTYLCSRDLLKEVSYSLTQLAKSRLNKDRKEIGPHDIPAMFQASKSLIELVEYGETDAWLSMELMFHLSVLPLTRQLTNISGNLWGKSLQGARAQRVEYLLLHAFHAKKFIVPDKISSYAKEVKMTKKRTNHGAVERNANQLDNDDVDFDNEIPQNEHGKGKKGPAYAGGLVLEPKKGLYDRYVLLLDFNSLYPSIIQEYNICFTTVERSSDELVPRLPSSTTTGVLPELLKNLVERRRMVKSWMKTASGLKMQQLDIQQQALKLIANSMYGCLGFSNSRFYAKPLAELITLQGREILQSTVDLVQNNLNLEVIYGDTDSIMIYSGLDDIEKAKAISGKVIREVNKKYRCLEIDLDGLYKRMLLLKKKKYAAVKVQLKDGMPYEVIERKGLDMVRRDWSLLSKELGDFCLAQILSGGSCDDVVESIHNSLMKVQEDMRNGQVALEKYVITKTLTKQPETYPDAKNQPHVLVALRLKQSGYTTGCSAGDTVPYVICCEPGASSGSSTGIAQRARHPDELKQADGNWMIDIDYYLAQQIHPVVSRLCASIQGTSPERLADCLGLDSSKFKSKSSEGGSSDPSSSLLFSVDDEERYQSCEPLILTCPSCSGTLNCPAVFSSICKSITEKATKPQVEETIANFWRVMCCPKCLNEGDAGRLTPAMIANQVKRQADGFVSTYYKGLMMCDDETCQHSTRRINLQVIGDSERGTVCPNYPRCNGHLIRKYTEADLYRQLSYFCYLLDTRRSMEKMDAGIRISVERELTKVQPVVELAASTVQRIRDRCAYGWIRLSDLVITV